MDILAVRLAKVCQTKIFTILLISSDDVVFGHSCVSIVNLFYFFFGAEKVEFNGEIIGVVAASLVSNRHKQKNQGATQVNPDLLSLSLFAIPLVSSFCC